MRKILSFLVLLMLFAASSYALPLTQAMYNNSGSCAYIIGPTTTGGGNGTTFYGDWDVNGDNYADLSAFSKLILNVSTSGAWRVIFNRVAPKGDYLEIYQGKNDDYYTWEWASDGTVNVFIDLVKIKREAGFARLNAIKNRIDDNLIIKSAKVEMAQQTWDFTTLNTEIDIPSVSYYEKFTDGGHGLHINSITNQSIGVAATAGLTFTVTNNGRLAVSNGFLHVNTDTKIFIPNMAPGNILTFVVDKHTTNALPTFAIGEGGENPDANNAISVNARPITYEFTVTKSGTVTFQSINGDIHLKSISVDKTHVLIGHRGSDSDWNTKYMDSPDWNMPVTLRDINDNTITLQGYTTDDFRITAETNPDLSYDPASDVVIISTKTISTGSQGDQYLSQKLQANHLGVATLSIEFLGNDGYYPASDFADITVKQHIAVLSWVDGNNNDVENITTSTTSGSLPNAPTLKQYKDYEAYTGYNLIYSSTDETVATVNSSGSVTIVGAGITTIQATLVPQKKVINGITHYYYNEAADSYTLIVTNGSTSGTQPRIIWVTAVGYNFESNYYSHARGSYMGQKFADEGEYVGYEAPYGNNVFVSAIAIKSTVTDADLATRGILPIPNSEYPNHYYVMDDPNNTYWNKGGWRAYNTKCIPANWRFNESDDYQNDITYLVSNRDQIRTEEKREGEGGNAWGIHVPTSTYVINPAYPDKNPLLVYAYIKGYDAYSTTPVLVTPGKLQLRFVPDHNTVNQGKSIMPYVNCPDLRMEDVNKIYLSYTCDDILSVPNNNKVVYETGKTSAADIAKYLKIVTSNDTIWVNPNGKRYNDDGTPVTTNIKEVKAVTWLRGINPEIIGKAEGNCTVTLHLESDMYETATADYNVTVLPSGQQMFHWEMNDKVEGEGENKKHVDDKTMKTIKITQGDFVYMPGIVGNANGNTQYSQPEQYKYMYGIQNGVVIMNYKGYFPGEGIPNYYVSYSPNGNPSVPVSNTTTNQPAIVTWAIGLGDYWRYDSLMVYGNEPGVMYLCAQDAQTGQTCTPIKIEVLKSVGDEGDLLDQKHDELDGMSYPFTWDFEHIDMTEYIKDASNTTDGNGGTYWRKAWDDEYDKSKVDMAYNRDYRHEMDFYQYNGGFNADWDDKDGNKKSRQRWFKDIHVNGKYAPEFKGMMLNLAGLEYWEQKYQRFLIHEDGDYIRFQGGPIFVQLPGFGLLAKKGGIEDGTRAHDNYIGSTHNHINTAKYNVNEGYTKLLSVDNEHNVNIQYPVQTTNASGQARDYRNNKVRFVIKARGGRTVESTDETPNNNGSSQFHIGGASMLNEALDVNDINWKQGVHNGYSYYNLNKNETKVYIVELDPYDPELQDHIYLMFNNDVDVYWMAITNEPRNILSDFDGVTYAYPKDIDMDKTNQTLAQQTKEGIYTKADENGNYALASVGEHTIKNVYQVGSDTPGEGTQLQLKAYKVSSFDPTNQSVSLTEIEGNIPQNEGVMLYTEPRMSALTANGGHIPGLTAEHYDRGATAYSEWVTKSKIVNGKTVYYDEEVFHVAPDSTFQGNMYNNSHNYYTFPLYFIAMAENMSEENYNRIRPTSTGSAVDPSIGSGHVVTDNLLRPVTYGQVLPMDYTYQDTKLINFGYNNEFICRKLVYQEMTNGKWVQTKEMAGPYVEGSGSNTHEGMYYYRIGIDNAKFYRINTSNLNHHNRSAYLTLTWDEYKVNTVGKPINMGGSKSTDSSTGDPTPEDPNDPIPPKSPIRFSPSYNPVDIVFGVNEEEQFVSEDGGFPDGINEVEQNPTGDGKVYNLNGVPVNTLSKGVYIINGKKIVVK